MAKGDVVWVLSTAGSCDSFTHEAERVAEGNTLCTERGGCFGCAIEGEKTGKRFVDGVFAKPEDAFKYLSEDLCEGPYVTAEWRTFDGDIIGYAWLNTHPDYYGDTYYCEREKVG